MAVYVVDDVLNGYSQHWLTYTMAIMLVAQLTGMLIFGPVMAKTSKHTTILIGAPVRIIGTLLLLPFCHEGGNFIGVLVCTFIIGIGNAATLISFFAIMADMADVDELMTSGRSRIRLRVGERPHPSVCRYTAWDHDDLCPGAGDARYRITHSRLDLPYAEQRVRNCPEEIAHRKGEDDSVTTEEELTSIRAEQTELLAEDDDHVSANAAVMLHKAFPCCKRQRKRLFRVSLMQALVEALSLVSVFFPVGGRCEAGHLTEYLGEDGTVGEATLFGDLGDRHVLVLQQQFCVGDPHEGQILIEAHTCVIAEEPLKIILGEAGTRGCLLQRQGLVTVRCDIMADLHQLFFVDSPGCRSALWQVLFTEIIGYDCDHFDDFCVDSGLRHCGRAAVEVADLHHECLTTLTRGRRILNPDQTRGIHEGKNGCYSADQFDTFRVELKDEPDAGRLQRQIVHHT